MITLRLRLVCLGTFSLAALLPAAAEAQQQQQPKPTPVTIDGVMKGMRGTTMLVQQGPAGFLVNFTPQTKVAVNGAAKADFLAPGMFVTFSTKVNSQQAVAEPLKSLKMLTPSEIIIAGSEKEGEEKDGLTPYYFAGYIKSKKADKFTVQYGRTAKESVVFEVADDAEISVALVGDARNVRLARDGDAVKIIGKAAKQPDDQGPGLAMAEDVTITLAEPLTNAKPTRSKND